MCISNFLWKIRMSQEHIIVNVAKFLNRVWLWFILMTNWQNLPKFQFALFFYCNCWVFIEFVGGLFWIAIFHSQISSKLFVSWRVEKVHPLKPHCGVCYVNPILYLKKKKKDLLVFSLKSFSLLFNSNLFWWDLCDYVSYWCVCKGVIVGIKNSEYMVL